MYIDAIYLRHSSLEGAPSARPRRGRRGGRRVPGQVRRQPRGALGPAAPDLTSRMRVYTYIYITTP